MEMTDVCFKEKRKEEKTLGTQVSNLFGAVLAVHEASRAELIFGPRVTVLILQRRDSCSFTGAIDARTQRVIMLDAIQDLLRVDHSFKKPKLRPLKRHGAKPGNSGLSFYLKTKCLGRRR